MKRKLTLTLLLLLAVSNAVFIVLWQAAQNDDSDVRDLAQAGAACVLSAPEYRDKLLLFASIEECDFGRPPVPGELLELRVETRGLRRGMGKMRAQCWVGSELLADGLLMFALADK